MRRIDFVTLRLFVAIADERSLTRAAERVLGPQQQHDRREQQQRIGFAAADLDADIVEDALYLALDAVADRQPLDPERGSLSH